MLDLLTNHSNKIISNQQILVFSPLIKCSSNSNNKSKSRSRLILMKRDLNHQTFKNTSSYSSRNRTSRFYKDLRSSRYHSINSSSLIPRSKLIRESLRLWWVLRAKTIRSILSREVVLQGLLRQIVGSLILCLCQISNKMYWIRIQMNLIINNNP